MDDTSQRTPGVAAEPDRLSVRLVVRFAVILTVVSIACLLVVYGVFRLFESRTSRSEAGPTPVEAEQPRTAEQKLPPEPRLEIDPQAHLARLHAEEDEVLHGYGWVDKPNGVVRIPIDRAMQLLVEREGKKP
jgi:hypothetical protein